jgi:serine/threonine protein kinase/formylglycine-generating enzyme required for sulfatase activity
MDSVSPGNQIISHYRIISRLGAGGMGEVYLAEDTKLNRRVAIKILPPDTTASEQANQRLVREARAAANLDHPNICAIHEVGEEDGRSFICMQYIEGETLEVRMKRKPLDLSESLSIATQVADALAEAHVRGTVHRDIKPANIMITARGAVKVMDFGLAKLIQSSEALRSEAETEAFLSTPGAIIGTLPYMSPEQVRGEALDGRSDIFSFGVVLYEMLSGQQPFASQSSAATASAILTHEPPPLARYLRDAPTELERIVSKSLRKNLDERYQTAKDLLIDLERLRADLDFQLRVERSSSPDGQGKRTTEVSNEQTLAGGTTQLAAQTAYEKGRSTSETKPKTTAVSPRKTVLSIPLLVAGVVLLAVASGVWFFWHRANVKWAEQQIPSVEKLAQEQKFFEAYDLATATQKYLPDNATIGRLMPVISNTISVKTDPPGAQVYLKRFLPDKAGTFPVRQLVGTTPIDNLRIARGQYLLYIEKDGYAKIESTVSGATMHAGTFIVFPPPIQVEQKLFAAGELPDRMVSVPGGDYRLVAWARPTEAKVPLNDYFIDKYEVSNQEFKDFINAGGYLKKQYWKYPFLKDGKPLSWEEAMKEFKDRSGLPGPRGWSNQDFPEGKGEFPVTDVSWYEASAYAAFRGKQLPTVFQWEKAARDGKVSALVNYMPWGVFYPGDSLAYRANFDNNGTLPVTSSEFGLSPFGSYNMAGNVSEWCLNEMADGFVATGGAWGDPSYTFAEYSAFPGFYSSNKRGFRCALNTPGATGDQGGMRIEVKDEIPVYSPSSDTDFKEWLKFYQYDKKPLDSQVIEVKETAEWRREKITFNGADGERAIAYLYLPKNFPRPLQVIHVVPAGDVQNGMRSLPDAMEDRLGPVIKSGRAAFGVVIKGYMERLRPEGYSEPDLTTVEYRDKIVNWVTDIRRGLDYIETRSDLDSSRIGFFGPSAGSRTGLVLAAVENRYRSILLMGAGLSQSDARRIAGANPVYFAPHISEPKLMLHGRYDEDVPLKTGGEPLFKLLREPKRLVLFEGGHIPPIELFVTTMNGWLDETLGPVKRE